MIKSYIIALLLGLLTARGVMAQYDPGDIEYGVGYVSAQIPFPDSMIVYSEASFGSTQIAVVQSCTIRVLSPRKTFDCSETTIPVVYNDEYGFPIIGFSPDSSWIKISLDCRNRISPVTGWVSRRTRWLELALWGDWFRKGMPVYFRQPQWNAFYSQPDTALEVKPVLVVRDSMPDYCMRVVKTVGDWMEVDLQTPSTFELSPEEIARQNTATYRVWIRYFGRESGLRIWYFWD